MEGQHGRYCHDLVKWQNSDRLMHFVFQLVVLCSGWQLPHQTASLTLIAFSCIFQNPPFAENPDTKTLAWMCGSHTARPQNLQVATASSPHFTHFIASYSCLVGLTFEVSRGVSRWLHRLVRPCLDNSTSVRGRIILRSETQVPLASSRYPSDAHGRLP